MVDLDHRVIHLERDKASGEERGRDVVLSDAAVEVLRGLPRLARGGFVFFGRRRQGHLVDLEYLLGAGAQARTPQASPHPRSAAQSHASLLIANGTSLYVTGKMLGHKSSKTTERYGHLAQETVRAAIDKAAEALS